MAGKNSVDGSSVWQGIFPLTIYYLVNQTMLVIGVGIMGLSGMDFHGNGEREMYAQTIIQMLGFFVAGMSVLPFYKKENSYQSVANPETGKKEFFWKQGVGIIFFGAFISLALNVLFYQCGFMESSESYQAVAQRQFSLPLGLALFYYGILSPWAEELIFRGILYRFLKRHISQIMAMLFSALLFGAFHGNVVQLVYGTVMGFLMAWLYERYENFKAPFLFHGAANVAVYMATYFF